MCSKCPDPALNLSRIIGVGILFIIFIVVLIAINLQKKGESNISVLMRIFTNYMQIITIALTFNLHFPSYMTDSLGASKHAGASQDAFLSFDCLLMDTPAIDVFQNVAYLKVICLALLPIILVAVS